MDVFDAIRSLHSVRKYLPKPVEMGLLAQVLEAARLSSSAGNMQNWRIIIVRDEGKRKAIAEASMQQLWMDSAPIHLVVVSEMKRISDFYGIRGDRLYAVQNCAIACQNMILTAHSLGLGSCWVGAFDEVALARICNIKEQARPQAIITLGYPDPLEQIKIQPRYRLENISWIENYANRVGDIGSVMWEFRFGERAASAIQGAISGAEESAAKKTESLFEKLTKKGKEFSDKLKKEQTKHKSEDSHEKH